MSAISAAQTATSTSGQTKQHHHHHHHQPLSSAGHSQSAANLLSTATANPHQPSSISPKAASSSSTASETASTTTGSIGTSTTNSSATNSITEGANNAAMTTATTTITTVNPNHDSSSSSSSVTTAAPYHPPSISNGSTNGSTHKQTNGSSSISGSNNNGNMSGYLFKWTNYLKGYQKRWIFLNNGFLSYYRSPNEMDHTCRGAINLANAHIQQNDDGVSFVVSNGGNQTFHLRAANDQERQKWISALETAKNKAPRPYHQGGAQQHPSSYINGIPSGKVGGGGGSSSSNAGGDLSDDDDENGAASTDAERNELESFLQVLQHKLNELSLSHEFVLKHSNMLTKSLTELENIQSKPDETAIKTINERSTIYKVAMNGVLNNCQEFINLAQFHTRKMHKILQSEHEIRLRLEDMVQEMAKQHLNIETQLSKRGKRIMAKGTPTTTNQSVSNKSQPSGGGVGGGTIKGGGQQQQATNNQQQQSAQQSSSQHQQKPSQETKSSAGTASNVGAGNVNSNEEDEDETYVANDDEFHDAVEDVTQFSVTLPRGKGLHQRNPSNISKLYLQESDDDEDEYDNSENDDGRATTIKVTMHSAATSADEAKSAPATTTTSSAATTATALATDKSISNGGALVKKKPSQMDLAVTKRGPPRQRRTQITPRPNYSINLWSIMKNCIGKDLSKIPIPVNFSEPISMLQRITEELEYAQLLDQAAECEDQWEQMALVAAFTVTSYSTTATRTNKPFNPLLGETFEFDRSDDLGWRSISEQVGHHPPGFAFHAESVKDWAFYQEFTMSSKFRGQYLQVVPLGTSHLEFKKSGHHYTWRKVSTFVRNIIVGKLWIDNVGEMDIINHKTKDVCHLKYFPYSYFSREPPRKVTGIITDANNVARYVLNGTWTEQIEGAPVLNPQVVTTSSTQLTTGKSKILWKRKYPPPYLESMYNFTEFAVQLNEPEDGVAPTDSRRRPDQRLMEEARWDEANQEKLRLEEKQRTNRKAREAAAAAAAAAATANMPNSIDPPSSSSLSSSTTTNNNNDENDDEDIEKMMRRQATHKSNEPEATWFKRVIDPYTNLPIHVFKNEYWECKAKQDWSRCPDLF